MNTYKYRSLTYTRIYYPIIYSIVLHIKYKSIYVKVYISPDSIDIKFYDHLISMDILFQIQQLSNKVLRELLVVKLSKKEEKEQ